LPGLDANSELIFYEEFWGLNLSQEKFNDVVGCGAPHNTAFKYKPSFAEEFFIQIIEHLRKPCCKTKSSEKRISPISLLS
jgi:hypothetical protein